MSIKISRLGFTSIDEYKTEGFGKFLTDIHEITIDGEPSIQGVQAGGAQTVGSIRYFVVHKGSGYEIVYGFELQNLTKLSEYPNSTPDIVSTIKFID